MKITEATLHDYAVELAKRAQILERQAETFHRDTNRDKYHYLMGRAAEARDTSEGLAWLLAEPSPVDRRLWSVKS